MPGCMCQARFGRLMQIEHYTRKHIRRYLEIDTGINYTRADIFIRLI